MGRRVGKDGVVILNGKSDLPEQECIKRNHPASRHGHAFENGWTHEVGGCEVFVKTKKDVNLDKVIMEVLENTENQDIGFRTCLEDLAKELVTAIEKAERNRE